MAAALISWEIAVTTWASAYGWGIITLLGTPLDAHSAALSPLA